MDLGLSKKRCFVGASSQGLGRATAEALAQEGADLVICSRDQDKISVVAKEIEQAYKNKTYGISADLSTEQGAQSAIAEAKELLQGIDVLVNNIGGPQPSSAEATNLEQWQKAFSQLFLSANALMRSVLPEMKEQGFGRIISITSISVVEPIDHLAASTSMRAALTAFSKNLATEVASYGITVNCVMPGVIHTSRVEQLREARAERSGSTLEKEMEATKKAIPMRRLGRPQELGDLVAFLASERAGYLTGQNICLDGGLRKGWT